MQLNPCVSFKMKLNRLRFFKKTDLLHLHLGRLFRKRSQPRSWPPGRRRRRRCRWAPLAGATGVGSIAWPDPWPCIKQIADPGWHATTWGDPLAKRKKKQDIENIIQFININIQLSCSDYHNQLKCLCYTWLSSLRDRRITLPIAANISINVDH